MTAVYADNNGEPGTLIASYEYDGQNRRIEKVVGENTEDYYWNQGWQLVELRLNGDPDALDQYIYDVRYIDAPTVRFHDGNTDGDLNDAEDNTVYFTSDANFNITGIISAAGTVLERYIYTPYGQRTVLEANWSPDPDNTSDYGQSLGHQGLMHDSESGLIQNRWRYRHTSLGFTSRDPWGYVDGFNLVEYDRARVCTKTDPLGTQVGVYGVPDQFCPSCGGLHQPGECPLNVLKHEPSKDSGSSSDDSNSSNNSSSGAGAVNQGLASIGVLATLSLQGYQLVAILAMLDAAGLLGEDDAYHRAHRFQNEMLKQHGSEFGSEGLSNAARHLVWSGELARKYGPLVALCVTDAHEGRMKENNPDTQRDLANNQVGINIGCRARTSEEVERLAKETILAEQAFDRNDADPAKPCRLKKKE